MKKMLIFIMLLVIVSAVSLSATAFKMPKGEGHYEFVITADSLMNVTYPVVKEFYLSQMKDVYTKKIKDIIETDEPEKGKIVLNLLQKVKVGLSSFHLNYTLKILFNENRIKLVYDLGTYEDNGYYPNKKEITRALTSFEESRNTLIEKLSNASDEMDF